MARIVCDRFWFFSDDSQHDTEILNRGGGPHRDLYGDLVAALRRRGLKTIATEHHIRTFNWYLPGTNTFGGGDIAKAEKIVREQNYDLADPAYADLYWNSLTSTQADFMRVWRAKLFEVIDKYHPDILWFDGGDFRGKESEKIVMETLAHCLFRVMFRVRRFEPAG